MKFAFKPRDLLLTGIAAFVIILYVKTANGGFPLDDSWIHQTYGRNLAKTGQWSFVPGIPSAASTSPLYTVLLSIGYKLGVDYKLWTHSLGALALGMTGILGARMAERLSPKTRSLGIVTGLALILAWHLIWAAASGMETLLFGMFTLALMLLAWRELDALPHDARHLIARGLAFGGLAALATLTRPDGLMLTGIIGIAFIIVRPQGSWRSAILWGSGAAVGFFVAIAPYLLLNLQLTGGLLPNTAAAKQAENALLLYATYPERIINLVFPLLAGGQLLLVPGMIYSAATLLRRWRDRKTLFYWVPLIWAAALIGLYAARLPAPYQHGRYVMPTLPSLIVVGVVGTAGLMEWGRTSQAGRILTRALAISAALAFAYFGLLLGPSVYRTDVKIIDEEMVASAHWIADHLPPDQLLAVHDIGAVGYFAPRPILDLAGLVSPEVIPIILDKDPLWALIQARGVRYLMAFPDQVPGKDTHDPRLCPIFTTNGATSRSVSGPNMTVYAVTWDDICRN